MPVDTQKIRNVVGGIRRDMVSDPEVSAKVKDNYIRVLKERGLTFAEIEAAHDLDWSQDPSGGCKPSLSLIG
jgi:hypothetical protein